MSRPSLLSLLVLALAAPLSRLHAQQPTPATAPPMEAGQMVEVHASELQWGPADVPGFAPGMQIAALSGDPSKPGPYTLRLRFPAGYAFPPHWHPATENLTVISGKFYLGMGDTADPAKLQAYEPGDYLVAPPRRSHFGRVEGETVIQLHGVGPFAINVGPSPAPGQ